MLLFRRKAFSLLELLVVITIIVMLSAILFPVLAQARESAKKATCFSNIRQAGFATVLYTTDSNDTFPSGFYLGAFTPNSYRAFFWWGGFEGVFDNPLTSVTYVYHPEWGSVYPYTKNIGIQACPTALDFGSGYSWTIGYGYNPIILTEGWPTNEPKVNASQVERPAETLLYGDAASAYCDTTEGPCYLYVPNQIQPPSYPAQSIHGRHAERANMTWSDGHATTVPITLRPYELLDERYQDPDHFIANYIESVHIGDIVHPDYPYNSPYVDYYFNLSKP